MLRFTPFALALSAYPVVILGACSTKEADSKASGGASSAGAAAGGAGGSMAGTGGSTAATSGAGGAGRTGSGGGAAASQGSGGSPSAGAENGGAGAGIGGSSSGGDAGAAEGGNGAASGAGGSGNGGMSGSSGSGAASAVDVFGIRKLYPSTGDAEWTSAHWDGATYSISERRDPNDPSGLSGMRGTGTLEVDDGVLTMGGSQPRIYVYPEVESDFRDLEITAYYQRVSDSDTAYAGLVIGARSGPEGHTDATACDAHTYYARVRNDGAFDFEKELEHPASATQSRVEPATAWPPDGEVPQSTWIGFKYVIYNVGETVKLEAYRDMTNGANGGDWQLVNETIDDGGWSVETTCAEHSPSGGESDFIQLEGGTVLIRNTDVTEARYRWVSIREIAP